MIQEETILEVADNSGVKIVKCFRVLGGSRKRYARVGDIIVCAVQKADPQSSVKKGSVVLCVVVRTKAEISRADGSRLRMGENCCVLLQKDRENPQGTRVFGSIPREVVKAGFGKIGSLANEVV